MRDWGFSAAVVPPLIPALLSMVAVSTGVAQTPWPTERWSETTPEAVGLSSATLDSIDAEIRAGEYGYVDRFLVIRNGQLAFDRRYHNDYDHIYGDSARVGTLFLNHHRAGPYNYFNPWWHPYYRRGDLHTLQSVTKIITSIVIGAAVNRDEFPSLDTPVLSFFDAGTVANVDDRKRRMTVRHLLTMTAGLDWNEDETVDHLESSYDWVRFTIDRPMADEPGTRFNYNSGASQLLSHIFREAIGSDVEEYAARTLVRACAHNIVAGNRIDGSPDGIRIEIYEPGTSCRRNVIRDNTITVRRVRAPAPERWFTLSDESDPTFVGIPIALLNYPEAFGQNEPGRESFLEDNLIEGNRIIGADGLGFEVLHASRNRIVNNTISRIAERDPFPGNALGPRGETGALEWREADGAGIWLSPGSDENEIVGNIFEDVASYAIVLEGGRNRVEVADPAAAIHDLGMGNRVSAPDATIPAAPSTAPDTTRFTIIINGHRQGERRIWQEAPDTWRFEHDGDAYHFPRTERLVVDADGFPLLMAIDGQRIVWDRWNRTAATRSLRAGARTRRREAASRCGWSGLAAAGSRRRKSWRTSRGRFFSEEVDATWNFVAGPDGLLLRRWGRRIRRSNP
jgi:parallel beta-helix repeat protein